MDNLGAIVGPLLALGLVSLLGVRTAILLSIIPGLLAALAIVYAIKKTHCLPSPRERSCASRSGRCCADPSAGS